jgi:hypothetical protein
VNKNFEFKLVSSDETIPRWTASFETKKVRFGGCADSPLKAIDQLFTLYMNYQEKNNASK